MAITVLCPTKGRPRQAVETHKSFLSTKTLADTQLLFIVNEGDEQDYPDLPVVTVPQRAWMNEVLQEGADSVLARPAPPDIIGFIGDDNRFRTDGWDVLVTEALSEGGIAYGNDLAQGENLPAHVFVTTAIVKALGWFGLPGSHHLYLDNTWKALGVGADCLHYLPNVVVEHLHPSFGKGQMDKSYRVSNAESTYGHDSAVFHRWIATTASRDIELVRSTLG